MLLPIKTLFTTLSPGREAQALNRYTTLGLPPLLRGAASRLLNFLISHVEVYTSSPWPNIMPTLPSQTPRPCEGLPPSSLSPSRNSLQHWLGLKPFTFDWSVYFIQLPDFHIWLDCFSWALRQQCAFYLKNLDMRSKALVVDDSWSITIKVSHCYRGSHHYLFVSNRKERQRLNTLKRLLPCRLLRGFVGIYWVIFLGTQEWTLFFWHGKILTIWKQFILIQLIVINSVYWASLFLASGGGLWMTASTLVALAHLSSSHFSYGEDLRQTATSILRMA